MPPRPGCSRLRGTGLSTPRLRGTGREYAETEQALAELQADPSEHSLGEFLLAAVELGRRLKVDPEDALRSATERAQHRYRALERHVR